MISFKGWNEEEEKLCSEIGEKSSPNHFKKISKDFDLIAAIPVRMALVAALKLLSNADDSGHCKFNLSWVFGDGSSIDNYQLDDVSV